MKKNSTKANEIEGEAKGAKKKPLCKNTQIHIEEEEFITTICNRLT